MGWNPVETLSNIAGGASDLVSGAVDLVGSAGQSVINAVKNHPLEAAALTAAGYYFAPNISAWIAPTGEAVAGTSAGTAAGAGAVELGTTSGAAWDAATMGAYGGPAAVSAATGLTAAQLAALAKTGVTLASIMAAKKIATPSTSTGTGGLLTQQQQDRSGFSSGSANYSPEYYAAIQSKYNQYMPQAKGENITNDLKNWYETKYTPGSATATTPTVTGTPTGYTTGTGYTTPTTMANLGIKSQAMLPSFTDLNAKLSTAKDVGTEYANFLKSTNAIAGGNTIANRSAALDYLRNKGFSEAQIGAAYDQYLSTLPTATGTTAETMAANSTPAQIAQAYAGYVNANGGDTVANREAAIKYLQKIGVPYDTIQAAYPIYKASVPTTATAPTPATTASTGGGMLTGSTPAAAATAPTAATAAQPLYSTLSAASNPQAIADAYKSFINSSNSFAGGDTVANRQAAIDYLSNLGVNQNAINQAYGLFKGA